MDELTVRCGNCKGKHVDALGVKLCYAETRALEAGDPAEIRRFLGEADYAKVQEFLGSFEKDSEYYDGEDMPGGVAYRHQEW